MPNYVKADQFFYPFGIRRGGYLELVDGKFGKHVDQIPEGAEVLDYTGYSIFRSCGYSYSWICRCRCDGQQH